MAAGASSRRMASHRMAEGRRRTGQILTFDVAGNNSAQGSGQSRQAPLEDRLRLSGPESRRSGSAITKAARGAAFIAMRRSRSPGANSSSPSARRFPPPQPPKSQKRLDFPTQSRRAALPIRAERRVPNSLATLRQRITIAVIERLRRYPCCTRMIHPKTKKTPPSRRQWRQSTTIRTYKDEDLFCAKRRPE